jgi:hypothetical protein
MNMIDVIKRLAELDAKNPNIIQVKENTPENDMHRGGMNGAASAMTPRADHNALMQKVAKVVNSPEFTEDTILAIVDAGSTITDPVGRYIQKEFNELQYDLGRPYEDYPERVADKLLSQLTKISKQSAAEATGDVKFDKMLKGITGKKEVAKQQKTDTKQQARDAFGSMFGGGNPADKLGIGKKGVAEGDNIPNHGYDIELEILNPNFNPEDELSPEEITVGVNYSISGSYRPATYDDPAEHPDLEYDVFNAETGEPLQNLGQETDAEIRDAIWADAEQSADDDFDIPDDNYDDRYYESNGNHPTKEISTMENLNLASIKHLAGIKTKIAECGIMPETGMSMPSQPHTPASISMTASSGPELSGMLRDIMQLAGMNNAQAAPAPISATPQVLEPAQPQDAIGSMRSVIDKLNPASDGTDDTVSQDMGDLDNDGDHDMDDHELEKKQPVDEYDNTPADPNDKNEFDADQYAHQENQPGQGDRMDGDRPKAYADMNEATADLFAQYKKFVNESKNK